ncbi:MAG: sigma 54-interacting transcriptional regulator [Myxococcaceae bacterium]
MPELVFFRRGDEVLRFPLERARVVLGRGENCDVVLPDPHISRQHVALTREGDSIFVEDLSGKGTLVSGTSTQKTTLVDGADIALGQWRAVFRQHGSGDDGPTEVTGGGTAVHVAEEQPRTTSAQLRVRTPQSDAVHRFRGDTLTLGKDADNDIVIEDPFVSSHHLRIQRQGAQFLVTDKHSKNGTYFAGARIYEALVPIHATLRLGDTHLTLEPMASGRSDTHFEGMVGNDPAIRQLAELIERVAPSNAAVAVLGESGTGKELVARALHARSERSNAPFIPVNCAAISRELVESELFGHEKGAFTGALNARHGAFEEANGGTLFLDEIGELPLDAQAKLLRALESGEIKRVGAARPTSVDVRLVAATNRDLLAAARAGKFREDLYYRLCVVPLHLPPLRNRPGDLKALVEHFVGRFAPRGQTVTFTNAALERLRGHAWPGNIRELRNVVHRALLLRKGPSVDAQDLTFDEERNAEVGVAVPDLPPGMTLEQMLERLERQIIETALRKFGNNRERVAKELGVARSTLFKRLKDWGLTHQGEAE